MLKVSYYHRLHIILLLPEAIVDRCYGLSVCVVMTKDFENYVDTVNTIYMRMTSPGWSKTNIDEFEK